MSNELVKPDKQDFQLAQTGIIPQSVTEAITIAKTLYASKMFGDLANAEQAVAKIMAGAEYGVPPVQSLNAFHIVKGKIMCHYSLIAFAVRRSGFKFRVNESTFDQASITFIDRDGEEIGTEVFTIAMAKKKGTQNLEKNADVMLYARAMSQGARKYVPEAFNGSAMYVMEERAEIERGTSETIVEKLSDIEVPDDFDIDVIESQCPDPEEPRPVVGMDLVDGEFVAHEYTGPTVSEDQGALV